MLENIRHGLGLIFTMLLRLCVSPRLRARLLSAVGATIGTNVRIHSCTFINLKQGFKNLHVGSNVHIGSDCLIDLEAIVSIGPGTTLSPRVVLISHSDPGTAHNSPISKEFPPTAFGVRIGENCWIGTASTLLDGSFIADQCVIGAGSVVRGSLDGCSLYAGVPVKKIRTFSPLE